MAEFIRLQYEAGKITAAKVWSYVPRYITEEQAMSICGPRPE